MPDLNLNKYSLYPSGFLGRKQVPKIEPINDVKAIITTSIVGHKGFSLGKGSLINVDEELLKLHKLYMANPIVSEDFDFREEVIKIALVIFGTRTFSDWYRAQSSSPSFGQTHNDFLDDTLNFVLYGKTRECRLETWASILGYKDSKLTSQFPSKLFNDSYSVSNKSGDMIPAFIQMWMSQEEGFDDMFQTLKLMFG